MMHQHVPNDDALGPAAARRFADPEDRMPDGESPSGPCTGWLEVVAFWCSYLILPAAVTARPGAG